MDKSSSTAPAEPPGSASAWSPTNLGPRARALMPGILVAGVIALASQFIAEHYGAPAMLLALLLGISLNFLSEDQRCEPGIAFGARQLLRLGVALLGLRISFDVVGALGLPVVALVVGAVLATIGFGLASARVFGFRYRFGVLSAGSVAICGASAAMAIAAILPRDERSEERLVFTVVGVTILSTVAMILYPVLGQALAFDDWTAGIYLGATIHDVAQVVGAGFSISDTAGETATLVKLIRVAMLAPIVVLVVLVVRMTGNREETGGNRPPLVPLFVAGFIALAAVNSFLPMPGFVTDTAASASRWLLLLAIAAVGLKTVPKDLLKVGRASVALLVAETVFLALLVGAGLILLRPQPLG
ncbi:MAG: putative sulfate exporter family transporter [Roseibium sp.]|uniref:YeiH family protein n=1 Tax=Roseibium sp. TaxID=1936156 RepID=UPI001B1F86A9|nr:putative sulfate exporter family transporter [Roseibium sp.]MBO6892697.1 putative sulfate exporter family transporter [Roseibium sp.]MBO6928936.1 putative sulfate exporter family transporter [Roseibium sp.]